MSTAEAHPSSEGTFAVSGLGLARVAVQRGVNSPLRCFCSEDAQWFFMTSTADGDLKGWPELDEPPSDSATGRRSG
jgi:hypothetical protein